MGLLRLPYHRINYVFIFSLCIIFTDIHSDAILTIYSISETHSLIEQLKVKVMTESAGTLALYFSSVVALWLECFLFRHMRHMILASAFLHSVATCLYMSEFCDFCLFLTELIFQLKW